MNKLKNQNSMKYLDALYDSLIISIKKTGKKIVQNSALFTLMKMYSNDVYNALVSSSLEIPDSVQTDLEPLKQKELIKISEYSSSRSNYVITAKGIYYVESIRHDFDFLKILNFVQEEKMDFHIASKPLTNKEKVILTSLIALRAFNEKSSMDLNDENRTQKWEEIIRTLIIPFITRKGIIQPNTIFSQSFGHENPVSYLMRRANDLPKKTSNLFTSMNKNMYYLNINISDKNSTKKQIAYLLGKIFQNISDIEEANEIKEYFNNIAQSQGLYVYDYFEFINYEWDKILSDSIDKLYLGIDL